MALSSTRTWQCFAAPHTLKRTDEFRKHYRAFERRLRRRAQFIAVVARL